MRSERMALRRIPRRNLTLQRGGVCSSSRRAALRRELFFSRILPNFGCYTSPVRRTAREVSDRYLAWAGAHADRPHFALLNYFDAHDPYAAPEPFREHRPANASERLLLRFWWF